jgi:hypothetical protein
MENPTLVFLTDRNDLDDQLFGQFQRCHEILRQAPVQADSVEHLRKLLNVASGGVVFITRWGFGGLGSELTIDTELKRHRNRTPPPASAGKLWAGFGQALRFPSRWGDRGHRPRPQRFLPSCVPERFCLRATQCREQLAQLPTAAR